MSFVIGNSVIASGGSTSISATVTGSSGTNLVGLVAMPVTGSMTTPTWDGRSMTLIGSGSSFFGRLIYLYVITAPTNGTISVTGLDPNSQHLAWMVFDGINQTTPTRSPATTSGVATNVSLAVTSVANDDVADFMWLRNTTSTVGADQTERGTVKQDGDAGRLYMSTETASGTTTTMSWTNAVAESYGIIGVSLIPAGIPPVSSGNPTVIRPTAPNNFVLRRSGNGSPFIFRV